MLRAIETTFQLHARRTGQWPFAGQLAMKWPPIAGQLMGNCWATVGHLAVQIRSICTWDCPILAVQIRSICTWDCPAFIGQMT